MTTAPIALDDDHATRASGAQQPRPALHSTCSACGGSGHRAEPGSGGRECSRSHLAMRVVLEDRVSLQAAADRLGISKQAVSQRAVALLGPRATPALRDAVAEVGRRNLIEGRFRELRRGAAAAAVDARRATALDLVRLGRTARDAAVVVGVSYSTVLRWAEGSGVALSRGRRRSALVDRAVGLCESGASVSEAAAWSGAPRSSVYAALQRARAEARAAVTPGGARRTGSRARRWPP